MGHHSSCGKALWRVAGLAVVISVTGASPVRAADAEHAHLARCLSYRVDDRLPETDVQLITEQVRRRTKLPIVLIGEDPKAHPQGPRRRLQQVEVRILDRCTSGSLGGSTLYLKKTRRGWRLDPARGGTWGAVA